MAPPERCPSPRWFSIKFSDVFEAFVASTKKLESNVHILSLYPTDASMFELDGRHFKSFVGKDYLDSLLAQADAGMIRVTLDADVRASESDNRLVIVESRVALVREDLGHHSRRLNVVVARAAEEADAILNEKYDFYTLILRD